MRAVTAQQFARGLFALAIAFLVVAAAQYAIRATLRARANAACDHDLRQIATALQNYVQNDEYQRYPSLSSVPGQLIDSTGLITSSNQYWYLGWIIPNERSGLEWIDQYRKYAPDFDAIPFTSGGLWPEYEAAIAREIALYGPLYKGMPNYDKFESLKISPEEARVFPLGARMRLYIPLREGIERFLITDIGNPTPSDRKPLIPILFERPELHGDGGHVLYMDGHAEFVPYPGKFPMTPKFIEGLRSLDAVRETQ